MFGRAPWPRVGLMTEPHTAGGTGTAHATYIGERTAVCGAPTPFIGKAWPQAPEYWTVPYFRCPSCAQRTYPKVDVNRLGQAGDTLRLTP